MKVPDLPLLGSDLAGSRAGTGGSDPAPAVHRQAADGELHLAALTAELTDLEARRYTDLRGIHGRAERVLELARRHHLGHESARARLILADQAGRRDDVAGAFESARVILADARRHHDLTIAARAEAVLAWCLFRMGAMGDALAHAVEAVRVLPESAPEHFVVDHAMVLALLSGVQSHDDSYVEGFERALAAAERLANPHLLLSTLNNFAWSHWTHGRARDAEPLIARLEALSRSSGIPLNSTILDTVAAVLFDTGDLARAEDVARSILDPGVAEAEARARPEALLTLAKIRRRRGDPVEALDLVLRAEELAGERGLPEIIATAAEAKARLLADAGRYRDAYDALSTAHETWTRVRDREAEARAVSLHALFETDQARQRSVMLEELAERDALTGLWNRRHLDRLLLELLADHQARGAPLSVAILDVDHFKHINDARSHRTGDVTLARLGELLHHLVPEPGFTARLGGEEFVLVLPGADDESAGTACEAARALIRDQRWDLITDGIAVTVSIGFATSDPESTVSQLLGSADEALYVAKRAGRDRVQGPLVHPGPRG